MITCVGMGNPTGYPRLTFGSDDLLGGLSLVPVMVGMFAVSEVLRYAVNITTESGYFTGRIDKVFSGTLKLVANYPKSIMRAIVLATVVGALPGAGADIASDRSQEHTSELQQLMSI